MTKKINLIPDIECNLDQKNSDLMGTCPYVDVLERVIEENIENDTPLTIGLFGRWGSGKSSIIKTLSERLGTKSVDNSVKTVIYDAWKYSGDAFRRSFLLEMKKQLNLDWEEKLRVFYQDKHEDISTRIEIINKWWIIPLCLMPLLGLVVLGTGEEATVKWYVSFLSAISSGTLFLIKQLFTQYKISVTTPKVFSPEQFKEIFDEAISEVTEVRHTISWWKTIFKKGDQCKRVVIVFDNIDRCDKDTAKELLLNVKTYLEHNKCIVILPVDDSAIKSHLSYIGEEAEEFLRKIFNVSIRIKGLNNSDRYDFTKNLIEKYKLGFSNEVASVISQEFAKNPRRIIQFLNSLAIEQALAKKQESKGNIPKDSVTKNIDFLAKVLLLKEEYSFLYDKILFDGLNLSNWEELYKQEELYDQDNNDKRKIIEKNELKMFFGRTSGIVHPPDIRPYLMLNSKEAFISEELINLIQLGNPENVIKKIEKDSLDFNMLLNHLYEQLDVKLVIRKVAANPELKFIMWCFVQDKIDESFQSRLADFHRYFIYVKPEHISNFDSVDVMKCAKLLNEQSLVDLYKSIVSYVNAETDTKTEFLRVFIEVFDAHENLMSVKEGINQVLTEDIGFFEVVVPSLRKAKAGKDYINTEIITKHVDALSVARTETDSKICKAVRVCFAAGILPDNIHNTFLESVLDFLKGNHSATCYKFWCDNIKGCMKVVDTDSSKLIDWISHTFRSSAWPDSRDEGKEAYVSMIALLEECFILGENSVGQSIVAVYLREGDVSLIANSALRGIVEKTEPDKWNFLNDIMHKTSDINIDDEYFVVLVDILEKVEGQDIVKNNPSLLENWLNFIVNKEDIAENEKPILKQYCKEETFYELCKENQELAKGLFTKAISLKEIIDVIADIILKDPTLEDVEYLLSIDYESKDKIKTAIKSKLKAGEKNLIEWIKIVIASNNRWEASEYNELLGESLVHLATGSDDDKQQVSELWEHVAKDKISDLNKNSIQECISKIKDAL